MSKDRTLRLRACLFVASAASSLGASTVHARGQPEQDIVLDCQMFRAIDSSAAPRRWRARTQESDRFVWALRGRDSLFGADEVSTFGYHGPSYIFISRGVASSRIDWPRRVEIHAASEGGPGANREFSFRVLQFDHARGRVRVAVTEYRVPYGRRRVLIPVDGHFGDCRVLQGALAHQAFEGAE